MSGGVCHVCGATVDALYRHGETGGVTVAPFMVCGPCMNGPDTDGNEELARAWRIIDNAARELADTRIMAALPDDARGVFDGIAWTLGYVAAMIDPHPREETDTDGAHPFGNATERGN